MASVNNLDQYADGRAAKVWELYGGDKTTRTDPYREWFVKTFKENGVQTVADVACGIGTISIMLLEEGFRVTSCDASDKMLKRSFEERWRRRKEPAFDNWVIKEANWLTLDEDLLQDDEVTIKKFDAVMCCGNSFPLLPDMEGVLQNQQVALKYFYSMLKPGGILCIDHRNFDAILDQGCIPQGPKVYYQSKVIKDIKCSNRYVDGKAMRTILNYEMDLRNVEPATLDKLKIDPSEQMSWKFSLSCYPHRLQAFCDLLKLVFGESAKHEIYADFQPLEQASEPPGYYMHVIQRSSN